jgi:ABC-type antimicrobial peptide transport system permease subunit
MFGLYGVLSYEVARRTREIGLRMAPGATRARVLSLIIRQSLSVVAGGTVAGILLALAGTRLIAQFLYGLPPNDVSTISGVDRAAAAGCGGDRRLPPSTSSVTGRSDGGATTRLISLAPLAPGTYGTLAPWLLWHPSQLYPSTSASSQRSRSRTRARPPRTA